MKWWEKLKRIIDSRRDLTVEKVAADAKINVKSLYGYLNGDVDNPRGDTVARLARAVGTTEQALRYEGLPENFTPLKQIPLLQMTKLGTLKVKQDAMSVWDGVSYVSVSSDIPDGSYGVVLGDDSGGTDFPEGSTIICNPAADVQPGRYVVAVLTDEQRAHFGKFRPSAHRDTKHFTLVRPNPDFPNIEVGGKTKGFILARAIKHIRDI